MHERDHVLVVNPVCVCAARRALPRLAKVGRDEQRAGIARKRRERNVFEQRMRIQTCRDAVVALERETVGRRPQL